MLIIWMILGVLRFHMINGLFSSSLMLFNATQMRLGKWITD